MDGGELMGEEWDRCSVRHGLRSVGYVGHLKVTVTECLCRGRQRTVACKWSEMECGARWIVFYEWVWCVVL